MIKADIHEKQRLLTERLIGAARAYYDEDAELMSNFEYDRLYDDLLALESETGIIFAGSPTQLVGFEVSSALTKLTHPSPMLSLNKTKEIDELASWLSDRTGLLSYKLDGLTVAMTYENGTLQTAVTRGNGLEGEVVTNNAQTFMNLPSQIPFAGKLTLRGEAIIRYDDFEKINREIEDIDAKYKNPRNLVSGSVRQLDSAVTAKRRVRFYAFALVEAAGKPFDTRTEQMNFLAVQGFETVAYETVEGESALIAAVEQFSKNARTPGFDLPVDGLVLGFDDLEYSASLGATAKFPRDAIAFKWQDEEAETELLDIEWSASRTGLINPIAIFWPVELEGTTVSRASVHNVSILEELALGKGDRIKVYKANMIIPQIAENLSRSGTEQPPVVCPVCGAVTELRDSEGVKTLYCTNMDCPARRIKAFSHFVSRTALNIEGLSEQSLEKFIAAGLLHELSDIFRLKEHRDTIISMEGFGERSFENLITAVEAASHTSPDRALVALGIPEIGSATAKAIARALGHDWAKIVAADKETLSVIDGVGDVIADLYTGWFGDPGNKRVSEAVAAQLHFETPQMQSEGGPLEGKIFVITGSLENHINRDALKERIETLGGKTASSVSAKTDYLINNDQTSQSSKNKTAKSLGVKIITEDECEVLTKG